MVCKIQEGKVSSPGSVLKLAGFSFSLVCCGYIALLKMPSASSKRNAWRKNYSFLFRTLMNGSRSSRLW